MTTAEQAEYGVAAAVTARRRRRWLPKRGSNLWRHLVALLGIVFALFPIVYVTGAAFNEIPTLVGASANPIPQKVTLDNFKTILSTHQPDRRSRRRTSRCGTSTRSSSRASRPSSAC